MVTTFSRQAMPLVRFRSNDRVRLLPPDLCDCGRTSRALWEVGTVSRYDDMIKIKEMTQVSMTLEEVPYGTLPRFEYKVRRWTDERIEGLERIKYIEKE